MPAAVEELLRYESPSQHTARLAPDDVVLGGKQIRKRQAVIAVMAAGNRDPVRFPEPDHLDFDRPDNRHLAFGWGAHFCFGAPLARLEGHIAFETLLRRFPELELTGEPLVFYVDEDRVVAKGASLLGKSADLPQAHKPDGGK